LLLEKDGDVFLVLVLEKVVVEDGLLLFELTLLCKLFTEDVGGGVMDL
jgi:hypothetical protein